MTPSQIELAARKLCELRGQDPDKRVGHSLSADNGAMPLGMVLSPRWVLAAKEVTAFHLISEAIMYSIQESQ